MHQQIANILKELKEHAPFTAVGAGSGIILLIIFQQIPRDIALFIFYVLHPIHVVLSALVTASIYKIHSDRNSKEAGTKKKCNFFLVLLIGYIGAIGIATLSDCLIPYLGEALLDMPNRELHIGFIDKWWLINPLALIGVSFAYIKPSTKFPHAGHVLLSTWASLFHVISAIGVAISGVAYVIIFIFLFIAVWAPCCISDIAFPLLFVRNKNK